MNLLVSPDKYSCLAYATAMVLGETIPTIHGLLGHQGTEKIWPMPNHDRCAGFHIYEVIDMVWRYYRMTLTPFIKEPRVQLADDLPSQPAKFAVDLETRFNRAIQFEAGIFAGRITNKGNTGHAVAWDGHRIYDPRGHVYLYKYRALYHFEVDVFWMFRKATEY